MIRLRLDARRTLTAAILVLALALASLLAAEAASSYHTMRSQASAPDAAATAAVVEAAGFATVRLEATPLALDAVAGPAHGLVVHGTGRAWDARELAALERFVERGGRVLVLGDAAAIHRLGGDLLGTPIAEAAGDGVRVEADVEGATHAFRVAAARPLLVADAVVVAWSTTSSFVDVDGDGRATAADAPGPFTIVALTGDGRVALSGATRLLASDESAGARFAADLLRTVFPGETTVIIDDTRGAPGAPAIGPALARAALSAPSSPEVAGLLLALAAVSAARIGLAHREQVNAATPTTHDTPVPLPPEEVIP